MGSSWKDYAAAPGSAGGNATNGHHHGGHHSNYAYESYEADPRGMMPPLPPGGHPRSSGYHHHHQQLLMQPPGSNGSLQKSRSNYSRTVTAPTGYSLPRNGYPPPPPPGYGSYDRRGFHGRPTDFPPDHYFMPSQRKYSGETIRVFVDYK